MRITGYLLGRGFRLQHSKSLSILMFLKSFLLSMPDTIVSFHHLFQAQKETEQKNGSKKASFVGEISYASLSQLATDDNYVSAPNDLALTQPNGEDSTNNNILTNSPHSVVPLVRADSNNSPVGTNPPVKDDGDITNLIDSMCQKIFPASFMFFNLVYWFWFSFK